MNNWNDLRQRIVNGVKVMPREMIRNDVSAFYSQKAYRQEVYDHQSQKPMIFQSPGDFILFINSIPKINFH